MFKELIASGTVVLYMDDLIVPLKDEKKGLEQLEEVFKVASEYILTLNWKKCVFLRSRVTFLGYIVENGTIRASIEKTKDLENYHEPKNVKAVQSFLGLTGFFRKFILRYACIARPLSNLTAKNVHFKFERDEREAFQRLKHALCQEPVLALYSPNAETELHTDASSFGLRAILFQ